MPCSAPGASTAGPFRLSAEQRTEFGADRIPVRSTNHFGIDCERRRRIEVPDLVLNVGQIEAAASMNVM
jgi:hypothetical protein